jgi:hypothetical protein
MQRRHQVEARLCNAITPLTDCAPPGPTLVSCLLGLSLQYDSCTGMFSHQCLSHPEKCTRMWCSLRSTTTLGTTSLHSPSRRFLATASTTSQMQLQRNLMAGQQCLRGCALRGWWFHSSRGWWFHSSQHLRQPGRTPATPCCSTDLCSRVVHRSRGAIDCRRHRVQMSCDARAAD